MPGATGAGWAEGLAHPFSGLDHVLAMVAVGLWAAQMGRPAAWLLPLAFPAVMAVGPALGVEAMRRLINHKPEIEPASTAQ